MSDDTKDQDPDLRPASSDVWCNILTPSFRERVIPEPGSCGGSLKPCNSRAQAELELALMYEEDVALDAALGFRELSGPW